MSGDTKKAIEELVRGRELTNQLRDLLSKSAGYESGSEDLVIKICNTFANSLSILRNPNRDSGDHLEVCQKRRKEMRCDGRKPEDWGEIQSSKTSPSGSDSTSTPKDGREGSYKSRFSLQISKCENDEVLFSCYNGFIYRKKESARKSISSALTDDGYAWRKYGQKQILNSIYPRSYYRCTYRKEQGCLATKQVQMIQDDPPKFESIYLGHHTCKNTLDPSHFILDHPISDDPSRILSFANKQYNPFFSSPNQESNEITYNGSSSSDYLSTIDPSAEMSVLSADQDVISGFEDSLQDLDELLDF
ncbi:hypothetical protein V6N11_007248 [Hibiscus sabdariffa]|uniref:WRKY domain-containing protein n=1 Tax=Hibiscus sabdariffa TaxID=183260 RepID=A0ABR2RTF7_9ROSI